ncbi:hypothetical protein BT96DRAFT_1017258 [Gymnopus androsaceus JB14]|uniref:HD domain-containing protein n=1 Tax=Gymnopus androsaceus JB14 TaxID=1447944 RepID=A0A6A4HXR5_9AGAR|nr:hypothetical protein BT96DRAFT_1017258 [Gymnopus androsaceus JB14]
MCCATSTEGPEDNLSEVPDCIPSDPISQSAYTLAHKHLPHAILNHSLRVWIYAQILNEHSEKKIASNRLPLLFTACMIHDIGATPLFANLDSDELQRFEIEGADAAVALLKASASGFGDTESDTSISKADLEEVWRAIALHTSPQIAERMGGMVRIVRLAVLTDFGRGLTVGDGSLKEGLKEEVESKLPRLGIEKVLGDAVVTQALDSRMPEKKAPAASWPNNLLRAHRENPEWEGVNKAFG